MRTIIALLALLALAGCATNSGVDPKQADDLQSIVDDADVGNDKVFDDGSSGGGGGFSW